MRSASPAPGASPITLLRLKRKRVPGTRPTASISHANRRSRSIVPSGTARLRYCQVVKAVIGTEDRTGAAKAPA